MKTPEFNEEQLTEITNLISLNYSIAEIAKIINVDKELFIKISKDQDSLVYESIQTGLLKRESQIDKMLLKQAESGNTWATQLLSKRKEEKLVRKMIDEYLGNE